MYKIFDLDQWARNRAVREAMSAEKYDEYEKKCKGTSLDRSPWKTVAGRRPLDAPDLSERINLADAYDPQNDDNFFS